MCLPNIQNFGLLAFFCQKGQTTIYKTPHKKLKIEQYEKARVNSGAPEG
jgi:hypothetical protein